MRDGQGGDRQGRPVPRAPRSWSLGLNTEYSGYGMYFSTANVCVTAVLRLKKCCPSTTEMLSLGGLGGGNASASPKPSPAAPRQTLPAAARASGPSCPPRVSRALRGASACRR